MTFVGGRARPFAREARESTSKLAEAAVVCRRIAGLERQAMKTLGRI